jgi:hypothetical protein
MSSVDTTKLTDALKKFIPSVDSATDAGAVKSSGLLESLQKFSSSLSSFSANASGSGSSTSKGKRTVRQTAEEKANEVYGSGVAPDEEAIFKKNKRLAQSQIDLINQNTDEIISQDLESGKRLQARGRALNNNSGLGGSTFATKNAEGIDSEIDKVVASRRREANTQIQSVLDGVAVRSSEQFQAERTNFLTTAEKRLDLIEEFNTNLRETAKSDIGSLVSNGLTVENLKTQEPETYDQLLADVGGSEELLNSYFASAVPQDQVLYESNINGRFVQVIQDPVTGEKRQQTFDLGDEFRTEGLKLITKTASGQLVFGPETLTDPSQLKIYGSVGQFGGNEAKKDKEIFTFDTDGKENLIAGGFSGSEVTSLQSDINEYGLDVALEGLDEEQQKIVRKSVKKEEVTEGTLNRDGVAKFLGIANPDDETKGKKTGGFLGIGGKESPSPKETVDSVMSFVESYRALNFTDDEIKKLILDQQKEQAKDDK